MQPRPCWECSNWNDSIRGSNSAQSGLTADESRCALQIPAMRVREPPDRLIPLSDPSQQPRPMEVRQQLLKDPPHRKKGQEVTQGMGWQWRMTEERYWFYRVLGWNPVEKGAPGSPYPVWPAMDTADVQGDELGCWRLLHRLWTLGLIVLNPGTDQSSLAVRPYCSWKKGCYLDFSY